MPSTLQYIHSDLRAFCEGRPTVRKVLYVWLFNSAFHAVCLYRVAHGLSRGPLSLVALACSYLGKCLFGVLISPRARIGRRFRLVHGLGTVIGMGVTLGEDCVVYQGVTLGTAHDESGEARFPQLGDRVTVFAGAKVLGGVTLGDDSAVAANAVLLTDLPPASVAAGVPAQIIRRDGVRVAFLARDGSLPGLLRDFAARLEALEGQVRELQGQEQPDDAVR